MKDYDPLTPEEVNDAAKEFFPLFDIVHRSMPENCTVEDTIKVMETVCSMAQKRRRFDKGEVGPFGFNKKVNDDGVALVDKPEDVLPGTVAIFDDKSQKWGCYELGG